MDLTDLAAYVRPLAPTLSVYVSVDGDQPAEAVVAVALGPDGPPPWLDRSGLVHAVSTARRADAAGLAWFQRQDEPGLAIPLADPPRDDRVTLAPVPALVPVVETLHRTLDHLVVSSNLGLRTGFDTDSVLHLVHVPPEREGAVDTVDLASTDPAALSEIVRSRTPASVEMVLLALPDGLVQAVADRLAEGLGPSVVVETLDPSGDLAEQSVRVVADRAATELVQTIRMFRFLESHDSVAQGLGPVAEALSEGRVRRLLVGLGLDAETPVQVSGEGPAVSVGDAAAGMVPVSAPDGLIRSALLQGADVRIIPEHLSEGPADGVGAMLRETG